MGSNIYIFIGTSITSIGGGVLYYKNKQKYLKSIGWDCYVFSFVQGRASIQDLSIYESGIIPELKFPSFFYSKNKQEHIIEQMITLSNASFANEIIVESNPTQISIWGELLAKKLNAKHFIYALNEKDKIFDKRYFDFLYFKYQRREIAGIVNSSLYSLFSPYVKIENNNSFYLSACPTHAVTNVEDVAYDESHILPNRINILSLGRFDKPYLLPTLKSFKDYALANEYMKFNLIMIGGSCEHGKIENSIIHIFREVSNANLVFLGSLFPIPLRLLKSVDICIASSGSAGLSYKFGIPTISIDGNDLLPIGILGINAVSRLFRNLNEPPMQLSELLNMLIKQKVHKKEICIPEEMSKEVDYSSHMSFVKNSSNKKVYYDLGNFDSLKYWIIRICGIILGFENCNRTYKYLLKMFWRK